MSVHINISRLLYTTVKGKTHDVYEDCTIELSQNGKLFIYLAEGGIKVVDMKRIRTMSFTQREI